MSDTSSSEGRSSDGAARPSTESAPRESRPLPQAERDFRRDLSRRFDLFHREIESLKERVHRLPRKARPEYLEMLAALEEQAARLERRVARYVRGSESWDEFRGRAAESWSDLKRSLLRIALSLRRRHPEADLRSRGGQAKR
jgi:hypothetical protein